MKTHWGSLSALGLVVAIEVLSGGWAARAASKPSALADASEIFENLTESAANIDDAGFTKAMGAFETLRPALERGLSAESKGMLQSAVEGARDAWKKGDRGAVASQSIDAYRVLQESIDRRGKGIPVELALLDYAGFKTKALLVSGSTDWGQAVKTADEAAAWWTAIRSRSKNDTIRAVTDRAIAGLKEGATRKDPALSAFAAELVLTLVDGLEVSFGSR